MIKRFKNNGLVNVSSTVFSFFETYKGAWTVDNMLEAINNCLSYDEKLTYKQVSSAMSSLARQGWINHISRCWYGYNGSISK